MKVSHAILSVLFLMGSAFAQHLDFGLGVGVKGGFSATDVAKAAFGGAQSSSSGQYIVGPVVELRLPFGFAAEADGLYHHADLAFPTTGGTGLQNFYSSWEVPYLAKFRFPIPILKPFIFAGGSYRKFNNATTASTNGFVTGLGLELRILRLRASAEGRYVRWGESAPGVTFPQNQAEVLFGLIF